MAIEPWFNVPDGPHGWVQWKGTSVCLDLHCKCGESSHFDGGFAYALRCPYCDQVYVMDGHVTAHPVDVSPYDVHNAFKTED